MRKEDFQFRLKAASFDATTFAQRFVKNKLSFNFNYIVALNRSCDVHLDVGQTVYPVDDNIYHLDLLEEEVVSLLCRESHVPQWIDINVAYAKRSITTLYLRCCGRYEPNEDQLYYYDRGTQPFGIKSPILKKSHGDNTKFRLPSKKKFLEKDWAIRSGTNFVEQDAAPNR
jgi:hypothetical protein